MTVRHKKYDNNNNNNNHNNNYRNNQNGYHWNECNQNDDGFAYENETAGMRFSDYNVDNAIVDEYDDLDL